MLHIYYSTNVTCSNSSADLQAAVLRCGVVPDIVLPLKFLHDIAELFECLKGLFGFLDGELGVFLLLPLRSLVHGHTGACIYGECKHHYWVQLAGSVPPDQNYFIGRVHANVKLSVLKSYRNGQTQSPLIGCGKGVGGRRFPEISDHLTSTSDGVYWPIKY